MSLKLPLLKNYAYNETCVITYNYLNRNYNILNARFI